MEGEVRTGAEDAIEDYDADESDERMGPPSHEACIRERDGPDQKGKLGDGEKHNVEPIGFTERQDWKNDPCWNSGNHKIHTRHDEVNDEKENDDSSDANAVAEL